MDSRQKKVAITAYDRKDISDYVHSFVLNMRNTDGRVLTAMHTGEAEHLRDLMNRSCNTRFKSFPDFAGGGYFWDEQEVDYVASNLRGFIFYFICNGCGRRVRYLYEYSVLKSPLCRVCCRLKYRRSGRRIS